MTIPYHKTHDIQDGTKINCFMECPRKYFYEYVLGWRPETPNNHIVFGRAWHLSLEHILTHGYGINELIKAHEQFISHYRLTYGPDTDELFFPKTPDNAFAMLGVYAKHYADDFSRFEVQHTEIAGSIEIDQENVAYFRMDSIVKDKTTGKYGSLEHKTGSSTWNWEKQWPLSMQCGIYTHVLFSLYGLLNVSGVTFNGVFFKKAKKGWAELGSGSTLSVQPPYEFLRYPAFKSPESMFDWHHTIRYYMENIKMQFKLLENCSDDDHVLNCFPMNPTSCSKYFGCQYHDFCCSWTNPLQRANQPPMGFIVDYWDPTADEAKTEINIKGDDVEVKDV